VSAFNNCRRLKRAQTSVDPVLLALPFGAGY
jgi:hypothetical protein